MDTALNVSLFRGRQSMVYQTEAAECGLACCVMIARHYGKFIGMSEARQYSAVSLRGLTIEQLITIASCMQLDCRPVALDLDELSDLQLPAILHWDMNHFVVLRGIRRGIAIIHDPALGERRLSESEMSQHFTGVAIEMRPRPAFKPQKPQANNHWRGFRKLVPDLKWILLKLLCLSVVLQGLVLLMPLYMQTIIDKVLASHDRSLLVVLAFGFATLLLLEILVNCIRALLVIRFSNQLKLSMSSGLFHHLMRLPVSWFEQRHKADIISRFASLEPIQNFYTLTIIEIIMDTVLVVAALLIMLQYDLFLTSIVILCLGLHGLIQTLSIYPLRELQNQTIQNKAKESSHFIETIQGFKTIRLFNHAAQRQNQWFSKYIDTCNSKIKMANLQLLLGSGRRLVFGLENILIIYLGAQLVINQSLSVGMLLAYISYKGQFIAKTNSLIDKFIQFRMLSLHNDRLSDITTIETEQKNNSQRVLNDSTVEVVNLSYRYSAHEPELFNQLSFRIGEGECVAITGDSGIGKSTLVKLLTGQLEPTSGIIRIGGTDIEYLSPEQITQHMAVVQQDDQCFRGSLAQNISMFDAAIDMDWLRQCARIACLDQIINAMPMGYDTLVGDMGASLSGGQKQRLFIARALYKKPDILLLDEASAHLDEKAENQLNLNLAQLSITRIIIAHRPSTIASCERVIRLN